MSEILRFLQTEVPELRASLIGQFILRQLTKSGLSPAAVAEAIGVSRSTLYDYISGRIRNPPASRLAKLGEVLSLPNGTFDLFSADLAAAVALVDDGNNDDEEEEEAPAPAFGGHEDDEETTRVDDEEEDPTERPDIIAGEVEGYTVIWGELDNKEGTLFSEGSFTDTIAQAGQARLFYWEHAHSLADKGGSTPIGATFSLQEDNVGLWMRAWIANTAPGRDLVTLMKVLEMAGLEMGSSVAGFPVVWRPNFVEPPRAWERGVDAGPGALLSFDLKEVSLAGFPALNSARVRLASEDPATMIAAATERMARITGG